MFGKIPGKTLSSPFRTADAVVKIGERAILGESEDGVLKDIAEAIEEETEDAFDD